MTRPTVLLALATLIVAPPLAASEDTHTELPPHSRAPIDVPLVIDDDDTLRAPGEEWFEAQAELQPGRFTFEDEAAEYTEDGEGIGEFEGGWIDSEGEYEFLYDEDEDEFVYWQNISAETLTRGRQGFVQFCASCHGLNGDGYGRSGQHLRPPPRSFHQSVFKFTKVVVGQLPTDDALVELVKHGLDGTPMLPWALSDGQLQDIIQYVKSLSPEEEGWRDVYAEIEGPVSIGEDPFAGRAAAGVEMGEDVYHRIGCYNCHPGYVSGAEIDRILVDSGKAALGTYRPSLTYPKILPNSVFEVQGYNVSILPPDFTWHTMRVGRDAREVAETVAAGIGGAGMPQWKGSITDEEIWAVGYYVRHLVDEYKDQPAKRAAFMAGLRKGE